MKWFLVGMMMLQPGLPETERDIYLFSNPYFDYPQECLQFAQENENILWQKLVESYNFTNAPHGILCVHADKVKEMFPEAWDQLDLNKPEKTKEPGLQV